MWIYEHQDWPDFTWDAKKLVSKLADIRHMQGRLLGKMEHIGFELKNEANLITLTNDIVKSSAIEGEMLDPQEVRSSIALRLGINIGGLIPSSRNVDGIVEIMLDATQNFSSPLTKERLFNWHAALFPAGRSGIHSITVAQWRTIATEPMQVISGPVGHEVIHFEAPGASKLKEEMTKFLDWFERCNDIDPVLKAGIAHFWFVTIHPFEDGNGRIARAIADMALARADKSVNRFYSLSSQIESERKEYYNLLERHQRGNLEISGWLEWFLTCLGKAISRAEQSLSNVMYKAMLWSKINYNSINQRQQFVINRMLEDDFKGYINTSKYARLVKCSNDSALRDILKLKSLGVLIQNLGKGRSTSYRLQDKPSD